MSLVWQKQLLLQDYRRVCGPEGDRGKYTDRVIRPHRVGGGIRGIGIELVTCLYVNQWIWWQGLLGKLCREFLNGINIPVLSLSSPFPSPPPRGSQDREANQFVNVDGAKAAINKVSVPFTFCPGFFFFNSQGLYANTSQAAFKWSAVLTLDADKFDIKIKVQQN